MPTVIELMGREVTLPDDMPPEAVAEVVNKQLGPAFTAQDKATEYQLEADKWIRSAKRWELASAPFEGAAELQQKVYQPIRNMGRMGTAIVADIAQNWRSGSLPWKYDWENSRAFWAGGPEQAEALPVQQKLEAEKTLTATVQSAALDGLEALPLLWLGQGSGAVAEAGSWIPRLTSQAKTFGPVMAGAAISHNPDDVTGAVAAGVTGATFPVAAHGGATMMQGLAARMFPAMGDGGIKALGIIGSQIAVDTVAAVAQSPDLYALWQEDPKAAMLAGVRLGVGNAIWAWPEIKGTVDIAAREMVARQVMSHYQESPQYKQYIDSVVIDLLHPELAGVPESPIETGRRNARFGKWEVEEPAAEALLQVPDYVRAKWDRQRQLDEMWVKAARTASFHRAAGEPQQAMEAEQFMDQLMADSHAQPLAPETATWAEYGGRLPRPSASTEEPAKPKSRELFWDDPLPEPRTIDRRGGQVSFAQPAEKMTGEALPGTFGREPAAAAPKPAAPEAPPVGGRWNTLMTRAYTPEEATLALDSIPKLTNEELSTAIKDVHELNRNFDSEAMTRTAVGDEDVTKPDSLHARLHSSLEVTSALMDEAARRGLPFWETGPRKFNTPGSQTLGITPNPALLRFLSKDLPWLVGYGNPINAGLRIGSAVAANTVLTAAHPIRLFFEELPARLERLGGPESKRFANLAYEGVSRAKALIGEFAPTFLDPAMRVSAKFNEFTEWANDHAVDPANPNVGFGNLFRMDPDYRARFAGTAPQERTADWAALVSANLALGHMAARGIAGFTPSGKVQRIMTAQFVDIIRQGGGEAWQRLVNGIAAVPENNMTPDEVGGLLAKIKADMDAPGTMANQRTISQEHIRKIPAMPSTLRVPGPLGLEVWVPLLDARPYDYFSRGAHTIANRVGLLQSVGSSTSIAAWRQRVAAEGGKTAQLFDDVLRAMHGMPQDQPWLDPGSKTAMVVHGVNRFMTDVVNQMALTAAAIPNAAELAMGATPWAFGWRNYLTAVRQVGNIYADLESMGAVTRMIRNYSRDPNAPVRSALRQFRNTASLVSLNGWLNEAQEALAAASAYVTMERARGGGLNAKEEARVKNLARVMGFNDTEAGWLSQGRASAELRANFIRRAAPTFTAGAKMPAEQSKFMSSRLGTALLPFQSYATARINMLVKAAEQVKPGDQAATKFFARAIFGTAAQGVMSSFLYTLLSGGTSALQVKLEEAQDAPGDFLADSLAAAVGGPYATLWMMDMPQGLAAADRVVEYGKRFLYPLGRVDEVAGLLTGNAASTGEYKDRNFYERVPIFLKRTVSASKVLRTLSLSTGVVEGGPHQLEVEAATKGYWRWYTDKYGKAAKGYQQPDESRAEFRQQMRRFTDSLRKGDIDTEYLGPAIATNPRGAAGFADSLKYKKVLFYRSGESAGKPLTWQDRQALRARIGEKAYRTLEGWDATVEALADTIGTLGKRRQ